MSISNPDPSPYDEYTDLVHELHTVLALMKAMHGSRIRPPLGDPRSPVDSRVRRIIRMHFPEVSFDA